MERNVICSKVGIAWLLNLPKNIHKDVTLKINNVSNISNTATYEISKVSRKLLFCFYAIIKFKVGFNVWETNLEFLVIQKNYI